MQSFQDDVSSEGGTPQAQSKETSRKSKRASQELYVPRGRRQQPLAGESTACQVELAVDKPGGAQTSTRQQGRKTEKKRTRDGGKGKQPRDRKTSTDGEEVENSVAKEKKAHARGKQGRRGDQQRYVPRPQREDAKAQKSCSGEGVTLPAEDGHNSSSLKPAGQSEGLQVSRAGVKGVKQSAKPLNVSPVPEDWNEIDYDDREVTYQPTGTRLTAHGQLVPVDPSALPQAVQTETEGETLATETDQSQGALGCQEPEVDPDAKAMLESSVAGDAVSEEDNGKTRDSNSELPVAGIAVETEDATKMPDGSACRKSNSSEDVAVGADEIIKTSEDVMGDEKSPVTMATNKEVSQGLDIDARVSTNTDAVGSLSLNHEIDSEEVRLSPKDEEQPEASPKLGAASSDLLARDDADIPYVSDELNDAAGCEQEEVVSAEIALKVEEPGDDAGNDDGDDWDAMFDESGDCLKQEEIQELSECVGNVPVSVKHSKRDYYNYQPKDNLNYGELEHIIEVYDFPVDFKTHDLITGFCNMKTKEMDIKWIDDTHALAIFPSSIIAQDALSISNPMFRTRSLVLASREAKLKAKHCLEFLIPPTKPRPETSAATARRLVSGALGLKANISKEQRAAERQKIKEAKDRRRNEKKLQEDIWSGSI
ncbi:coiled-coil domain-containing protein R3HCC1L-like [Acanthaster planci]|uniref:Coiled-coil domain-containing protein R3HCC1L-like n=1 Tax=Acanthaster planci TaxID=133434 RepID=A0A8B7YEI7_ACAPL|nr:coiled-coil domain-containing protein R3HCC1L-like [Acanthaster planci]